MEAARAQYGVSARGSGAGHRCALASSNNQRVPASLSPTGAESESTRSYSAGLGVSAFELDLFGRVRSLRRAALEDYFRLEENRTAAQLLLVSEVANAWLTLIADRELLDARQGTRDSQRKSFDLTKLRFDSGVSRRDRSASLGNRLAASRSRHRRADTPRRAGPQCACLLVGEPLSAGGR